MQTLFKKLDHDFLVASTKIESAIVSYENSVSEVNV